MPPPIRETITSHERVRLALAHQEADRVPRAESFWPETVPGWHGQGMPAGVNLHDRFGYDMRGGGWPDYKARPGFLETVEETDEWITRLDGNRATMRYWKHRSGTPEHVAFAVATADDWLPFRTLLQETPVAQRTNLASTVQAMYLARSRQEFFWFTGMEAFEIVKELLGHENICLAAFDDPAWLREVFDTETDMVIRILDHYEANGIEFDGGWIYGDIAFNHGPFISPAHYRDIVKPGHARIVNWFKDRGKPVIYHTDGDFRPLIPDFLDLGIDCFQPLEAKANMDVRELKPEIGDRVTFMGNIDIMVLITNDPEQIEAEVAAKIPMARKGGGYIYHSDHSIPPGVTWESYQHLMRMVDRYGRFD